MDCGVSGLVSTPSIWDTLSLLILEVRISVVLVQPEMMHCAWVACFVGCCQLGVYVLLRRFSLFLFISFSHLLHTKSWSPIEILLQCIIPGCQVGVVGGPLVTEMTRTTRLSMVNFTLSSLWHLLHKYHYVCSAVYISMCAVNILHFAVTVFYALLTQIATLHCAVWFVCLFT